MSAFDWLARGRAGARGDGGGWGCASTSARARLNWERPSCPSQQHTTAPRTSVWMCVRERVWGKWLFITERKGNIHWNVREEAS